MSAIRYAAIALLLSRLLRAMRSTRGDRPYFRRRQARDWFERRIEAAIRQRQESCRRLRRRVVEAVEPADDVDAAVRRLVRRKEAVEPREDVPVVGVGL